MNYGVYRSARNASWHCLIDCHICSLPIHPVLIAKKYGIQCKNSTLEELDGDTGRITKINSEIFILVDKNTLVTRKRYTVMHEVGHYVLGHLGDEPLSRSEKDCRPDEEQAADKFAIDMLAPACVLWGLGLRTPEEIAVFCQISRQAATIRAERMELLRRRGKFLSHPLERRVYDQFEDFIRIYKK